MLFQLVPLQHPGKYTLINKLLCLINMGMGFISSLYVSLFFFLENSTSSLFYQNWISYYVHLFVTYFVY